MTARPDVPDTPDRTDAIESILVRHHTFRLAAEAILTTDDPAAVTAVADQWAERHPEALLAALAKAGIRPNTHVVAMAGRVVAVWRGGDADALDHVLEELAMAWEVVDT